jgi:osmotically-inducible protein OsmY
MRLNHSTTKGHEPGRWSGYRGGQQSVPLLAGLITSLLIGIFAYSRHQTPTGQFSPVAEKTLDQRRDVIKPTPSAFVGTGSKQSDSGLRRRLRDYLATEPSLTLEARAVKVTSDNGRISLRGSVRSESEKRSIEAKAIELAGHNRVTSELNITPQQ